jgi:beta-glucanase (GH16 family)
MKMKNIFLYSALIMLSLWSCNPQNNPQQPTVSLNKTEISLNIEEVFTLVATVVPISDLPVVWTSNNEQIAKVFHGRVTGKSAGTCTITATCGDVSAGCTVNILPYEPPNPNPEDPTEVVTQIGNYSLVWSDEFGTDEINSNVWNIEINGNGGGNNELQYYTARSNNVHLGIDPESNERCLILTAIKENYNGKTCTSGRVTTQNNVTFTHGLIEARIKIPHTANGLWPAFWLMGNDIGQVGWPRCGEIDIMEMGNANGINAGTQDRYFNGAAHWGQSWENHPNYARAATNSYSIQGSYHTFRLYWNNEKLSMYLDQDIYPSVQPYYEMGITPSDDTNQTGYYFHKPNFILFNLAVGGQFPNIYNINQITALNEDNNYTANYYIDYVRIYQKGDTNETLWHN